MTVNIPDTIFSEGFSKKDLLIELAAILYKNTNTSWSEASRICNLSRQDFMLELGKREIAIKYSIEDLENDLKNFN